MKKECITIGRREKISFPELNLSDVEAKIDTGAYTAALHCSKIWTEESPDGTQLFFKVLDETHPGYSERTFKFSSYGKRKIKNSSGVFESRYTIQTIVKMGRKKIKSSISLTDRAEMKYPVLIGRKLLKRRFLVDVSQVGILDKKQ